MATNDFPVEVVVKVVELDLQTVLEHEEATIYHVNCVHIPCYECPLDPYASTHPQCVAAVNYIRNYQLQPLLQSNPELFI